ncbi:MAG: SEL1-like repeat protein, partial [Ruminiclostridium sp.]|nr:SEL1-like repeat protein [Ruminiclostridium sp.]
AHKIKLDHLRWYAAFHNTAHHPHIHLLVYSTDPTEGFMTEHGIEMLKSTFANIIFKDELNEIYQKQTQVRDDLRAEAKRKMQELSSEIQTHIIDPQLEALIHKLALQLQTAKGKKVYGYLQPQVKKTVDDIVAMLAADPAIRKMYDEWCRLELEKYATYTSAVKQFPPLHENKVFKPIKNSVISAVLEMSHTLSTAECEITDDTTVPDLDSVSDIDILVDENTDAPADDTSPISHGGYYAKWTDEYREASDLIRSGEEYDRAYELLKPEADDGNVIAIYELAKMYDRGFLGADNKNAAEQYYKTTLAGFIEVEKSADKMKPFFQYRIGAMYNYGQGTEQNYTEAFKWFQSSAAAGNQYAMFALGNLYNYGKGVDKDTEKAFHWYRKSAEKNNAFAAYKAAKMLRNGIGVERDTEQAEKYFKAAYNGFSQMAEKARDSNLLYDLGVMMLTGNGCTPNVERGIALLDEATITNENARYYLGKLFLKGEYVYPNPELAIKLFYTCESPYAQYALGKIYLDGRYAAKDLVLAEKYLTNAAEHELDFAEYALGKLYLDDEVRRYDLAEEYLNRAAEHGNKFAMYRLAKLYLSGEVPVNAERAVELLQKAADKLNTAAYALGKLYLFGKEIPQDRELAVYWLTRASDMGNEFAQSLLEHLDIFEQSQVKNAYMNMLLSLVRLLNENYNKTDRSVRMHIDKKQRTEIHRKKQALGIKEDHTIRLG